MEHKMRRILLTGLVLLLLVGIVTVFYFQGELRAYSHTGTNQISANRANTITGGPSNTTAYIYYTLKQSTGFVLARALRGSSGQPVSDPQAVAGLWEVDAATGAHKNIDIYMLSAFLIDAVSSPDGSRIIYSTTAGLGMGSDTWLMNSDGSGMTHLFNNPGGAQSIAALFTWSPDGKTIAYERLSDSPTPFLPAGLWIMNTTGGQQYRLADADGGHGYSPVWSPDSRKIAFVARTNVGNRQADLQMQSLQCAVAVVDVTTSQSWIAASANQTGMQLNYNPSWAAGSASITFTASNPVNRVLGGMPRYWSARAVGPHMLPAVSPLTPVMAHIIATS